MFTWNTDKSFHHSPKFAVCANDANDNIKTLNKITVFFVILLKINIKMRK